MLCLRVLGAFSAELDGAPLPLGGPRQRAVLALLVTARGGVVSMDRLIEDLWSGEPPAKAAASLQAYVSNLRRLLEPGRPPRTPARLLVSEPPGYALRLPERAVDAWRFEELVREARALSGSEPVLARALLNEAADLWRGPAFAEFAEEPWAESAARSLAESRVVARELQAACALAVGDVVAAVAEADRLTRDEPLREQGWRLLALALSGAGRQADALAAVSRARAVLAAELGLDGGAVLADVETAIRTQSTGTLRATEDNLTQAPAIAAPSRRKTSNSSAAGSTDDGLLVGRDTELAALTGLAAEAAAGLRCRLAVVTGEPGIGKSALLAGLRRRLAATGWLVASGVCGEAEGAPPAWPWTQALAEIARATPAPTEAALALAPLISQGVPDLAAGSAEGRFRLRRAVYSWLGTAARPRPIAILIDDLHWADGQTLALLAGSATGLTDAPVLVVAAYRPTETDSRLAETLAELARHAPLRLALPGLSKPDAAAVIAAVSAVEVDEATIAALTERSGGNPFYLRESARLLACEGALVAVSEVPEGVRDVLRRRLARLPEAAVTVLRLAAVAGREAEVEVLIEAADTDTNINDYADANANATEHATGGISSGIDAASEAAVLDALEAGLIAGLLEEPEPGRVRFVHSLVRDALLADLSSLRARRMHARIAAALERVTPHDIAALAHHYAAAASVATAAKAVDYAVRAAEAAERRYAHDNAAALLTAAVSALERLPEHDHRADTRAALFGRLLRAQVRAGAPSAALQTRRRAVEAAETEGRDDLVAAAFTAWTVPTPWQSRPYGTLDKAAIATLERLLAQPGLEAVKRCQLLNAYAVERADHGDPEARAAAEQGATLAAQFGDPALHANILATLSRELDADLEWKRKAAIGRELIQIGEDAGLPEYRCYGRIVQARAAAAAGDPATARRLVAECLDLAHTYRLTEMIDVSEIAQAMFAHVEGDHEAALRRYTEVSSRMTRQGSPHGTAYQRITEAIISLEQGRTTEFATTAGALYEAFGPPLADLHALAQATLGRTAEARRIRHQTGPMPRDCYFTLFATFRAMAVVALKEREEASEIYRTLQPYHATVAGAASLSIAARPIASTLGELATLLDRKDEARVYFEEAAAVTERWRARPGG